MITLLKHLMPHKAQPAPLTVGEAVALARYYHRLGLACARRSDDESARRCRQIRDARLWEARQLAR